VKTLVLAVIMLAFCSLCWGETPAATRGSTQLVSASSTPKNAASPRPFGPADCAFTFTSGANNTFLKYCVTANGNVTVFESPAGHEHIAVGKIGEGYGICDVTSNVGYNDYAEFDQSKNWGPATVLSQSAKSVKIARTTSDGLWTLTQTFTQVTGTSPAVNIAMALKNNGPMRKEVALIRYVNVDADSVFNNNLDATMIRAFGWNSVSGNTPFGLVLQNLTTAFASAFIQNVPDGPAPCAPFAQTVDGPQTAIDGSLMMIYFLDISKGGSQTVTVSYKGF
jgi:hypothetical protein